MARCRECGKKGLFLKLNARGLCEECAEKAKMASKSGQIIFTDDIKNTDDNYASIGHNDEVSACQFFIDRLVERGKEIEKFKIEHRASDYTSLVYDGYNDFIRIKLTDNVSWVSIALSREDQNKYMNDPLFDSQRNKNQRHWRSDLDSIDQLQQYVDMAENACISISLEEVRELTEKEKTVADYLYDLFVECGAKPKYIYYDTFSQELAILYKCINGRIKFKAYAKKPGGYIIMDHDFDSTKIKGEKHRFLFSELSELDCLKEKVIPLKIQSGDEMAKYYKDHYTRYVK